jgi:hypothetical protein
MVLPPQAEVLYGREGARNRAFLNQLVDNRASRL